MTARYIRLKLAMVAVAGAGIFVGAATLRASAQPAEVQPTATTAQLSTVAIQDPAQAATGREATSTPTPTATTAATPAATATAAQAAPATATTAQTPVATATSRARQSRGS